MPKVPVYNRQGEEVDTIELAEGIFGVPVHEHALYETVKMQQANLRQGTAATKTRGLVSGGGRKPWRQKGTGRARHGSIRSPLWVGGGTVFGPQPRDYSYHIPKKVRRLALKSALSSKTQEGTLRVLDELKLEAPKTREAAEILRNLKAENKPLVVTAEADAAVAKSLRNIPGAGAIEARALNVLELLRHGNLILTRDAVARIEEVLG